MNPFLLTTAYFPPIAYFSCLKKAEVTYIEQYENFGKQSYRNRCEIMTANGVIALTVPVAKSQQQNPDKRPENRVSDSLAKITLPGYRIGLQKFSLLRILYRRFNAFF